MLSTRLWISALLIPGILGALFVDRTLAPWYPIWYLLIILLTMLSCFELRRVLQTKGTAPGWLCYGGLFLLVTSNWLGHLPTVKTITADPLHWVVGAWIAVISLSFLWALVSFERSTEESEDPLIRFALTLLILTYLGFFPCFFIQLRWVETVSSGAGILTSFLPLTMAIFVPKMGDVGAYFVGRCLGKHPLVPRLSPKKTWEGLWGGILFSILTGVLLAQIGNWHASDWWIGAAFGLTVGIAGVLGDLVESFLKRVGQQKDSSKVVPGFGGVLDVVDSLILSAPLSYLWFLV